MSTAQPNQEQQHLQQLAIDFVQKMSENTIIPDKFVVKNKYSLDDMVIPYCCKYRVAAKIKEIISNKRSNFVTQNDLHSLGASSHLVFNHGSDISLSHITVTVDQDGVARYLSMYESDKTLDRVEELTMLEAKAEKEIEQDIKQMQIESMMPTFDKKTK